MQGVEYVWAGALAVALLAELKAAFDGRKGGTITERTFKHSPLFILVSAFSAWMPWHFWVAEGKLTRWDPAVVAMGAAIGVAVWRRRA